MDGEGGELCRWGASAAVPLAGDWARLVSLTGGGGGGGVVAEVVAGGLTNPNLSLNIRSMWLKIQIGFLPTHD